MPHSINNESTNGCDRVSQIYCDTFNVLQPILLSNDDGSVQLRRDLNIDALSDFDLSALGLYIGKFVEQEINSSVVQLMRKAYGVDMPEYYCRHEPSSEVYADVDTGGGRKVRLNEQLSPGKEYVLKGIPLGDARKAFVVVKEEVPEVFADYAWISEKKFQDLWKNLAYWRNQMAHAGNTVDKATLQKILDYFDKFLVYMPKIVALKRALAPEGYFDAQPPKEQVTTTEHANQPQRPKPFEQEEKQRPKPPRSEWNRYFELENSLKDHMPSGEELDELNSIMGSYNWFTQLFVEDGKKGMKNAVGDVIIPAKYEEIGYTFSQVGGYFGPVPAKKEGKFGLVSTEGDAQEITPFVYDWLDRMDWVPIFLFWKDESLSFGIVSFDGEELVPCVLDEIREGISGHIFYYRSGEKWGLLDVNLWVALQPVYDNIEFADMNEPVLFTLNGEQGYVKKEDASFVPLSLKDTMDEDDWYDVLLDCIDEWDGL